MDYGDVRQQSAGDLYPYVIVAQEHPSGRLEWFWQLGDRRGLGFWTQKEAENSVHWDKWMQEIKKPVPPHAGVIHDPWGLSKLD